MKKYLILFIAILCSLGTAMAQAPNLLNYQGVARNPVGNVLISKNINLRLSIHEGSANGATVYSETRAVTTNAYGLFNIQIGSAGASNVTGSLATVNWGLGTKFLKVEADQNGGSAFVEMGNSQLASVPFAMNAISAAPIGPATGDLSGNYPNPTVSKIQGKTFSNSAPIAGQGIVWNSTTNQWEPGAGAASSLILPFVTTENNPATLLSITNNGDGTSIEGVNATGTSSVSAVRGIISSTSPGGFSAALRGQNNGTGGLGIGVWGSQAGSGWGVYGNTTSGIGAYGNSASGFGLFGNSTSGTGVYGASSTGMAANFVNSNASNPNPTVSITTNSDADGLSVESASTSGSVYGIRSTITSTSPGGFSSAVRGINNGTGGLGIGVYGSQAGSGWGIYGTTPDGWGVYGNSTATGTGVYGNSLSGTGVLGTSNSGIAGDFSIFNGASSNTVMRSSTSGIGSGIEVNLTNSSNGSRGINVTHAGVGPAVFGTSAGGVGVWGITTSISAAGVIGDNTLGEAVVGRNRGGVGVGAVVGRNDDAGYGVRGFNTKNGIGVLGQAGISGGNGIAGKFENVNAANTSSTLVAATNGSGSGIEVNISNASNGARGIDVIQSGVGPGVFSTSAGGTGVWGITSSISAAGVIGDNTFGEAVVGRNRGGAGVGAVVGRNDDAGYGVRGFNTKDGIGVLGQAGISGGTGAGGRFENVNAANSTPVLQAAGNGTGTTLLVSNSNAGGVNLAIFQKNGGSVARIDDAGKGFFNGGTQVGGADVAEFFDVEGSKNDYEAGDVLIISQSSDRKVEKSSTPYSHLVSGVYATKPGLLLTEKDAVADQLDGMVPMGVIGVIPTKVCLEGGSIKRGDMLVTSSTTGVAMKADINIVKVGQVIGKALQDYDANTIGKINVLVSVK